MIFPSIYEGLGGVALEAQLVGVPVIASDAIPKVVDVGIGMVEFLSLKHPSNVWAEAIMKKVSSFTWNREEALQAFQKHGYSIEETAKKYLHEYGIADDIIQKAVTK